MGSGTLGVVPGEAVHLIGHGRGHQLVIGRVKLDLVDAPTITVEAVQFGPVPVGQLAGLHQLMPDLLAHGIQVVRRPLGTVPGNCLLQWQITAPEVVAGHGLRLVMNFVRTELRFD